MPKGFEQIRYGLIFPPKSEEKMVFCEVLVHFKHFELSAVAEWQWGLIRGSATITAFSPFCIGQISPRAKLYIMKRSAL